MPSGRAASWTLSQAGCQSPAQPASLLWLPGTETDVGGTGPVSGTTPSIALPTPAKVDAADLWPAASTVTARYSTTAPSGRPATWWNTRGDVVSDVPSGVHAASPRTR